MIPYGGQTVSPEDIAAVVAVLKSDWLTQGPAVPAFEARLAEYGGAAGAVAVSSGTAALHLACLALGLGAGDRLWTSPISFVASANCGRYCGAGVDFVDIDPATANMSAVALEAKLQWAAAQRCLPKLLVVVHMAGNPCDMAAIKALADRYGVRVIEDASHALGAVYRGGRVGNCLYSDITVFSFHPVKTVTAGEGGAALSNDPALLREMELLRQHGIVKDAAALFQSTAAPSQSGTALTHTAAAPSQSGMALPQSTAAFSQCAAAHFQLAGAFSRATEGDWYYEQRQLGWNYRLSDIHAALGASQLSRCDEFVQRRNDIAARYRERLASLPCGVLEITPAALCSYHLFVIQVDERQRAALFSDLRGRGIGAQVHYIPIHTQPYYQRLGFKWGDYPRAEAYYRRALSLPVFPRLTAEEQDTVIAALESFWDGGAKRGLDDAKPPCSLQTL